MSLQEYTEKLYKMNPLHIIWIGVIFAELLTLLVSTGASYIFWGHVSHEILVIGAVDSLIVGSIVSIFIYYFVRKIHVAFVANQKLLQEIKERKKVEEENEALYEQLQQAQKLESLGVLAGGIAHDFNNLLSAILANVSTAQMSLKFDDPVARILIDANKATLQATKLTKQLLTFAKGGAPILHSTSIIGVLTDASDFTLHGSNVKPEFSIPDDLWPVDIDSGQINQVFQNLLINANQAMPDGGAINIEAKNENVTGNGILGISSGKYVKITIADQGSGIAHENIEKIFDPFFSTKAEGSGLGLATSYSIVKKHKGAITVDSKQGQGTTFQIYLPSSKQEIQAEKPVSYDLYYGNGKILIMDDEKAIRTSLARMLKKTGYEAEVSSDGQDALKMYKEALERQQPYDAVILDLTVPGGLGGLETLERLQKISPDVKAIVSSGYANSPALANYKEFGFSGAVIKPYGIQDLSRILYEVLNQ